MEEEEKEEERKGELSVYTSFTFSSSPSLSYCSLVPCRILVSRVGLPLPLPTPPSPLPYLPSKAPSDPSSSPCPPIYHLLPPHLPLFFLPILIVPFCHLSLPLLSLSLNRPAQPSSYAFCCSSSCSLTCIANRPRETCPPSSPSLLSLPVLGLSFSSFLFFLSPFSLFLLLSSSSFTSSFLFISSAKLFFFLFTLSFSFFLRQTYLLSPRLIASFLLSIYFFHIAFSSRSPLFSKLSFALPSRVLSPGSFFFYYSPCDE